MNQPEILDHDIRVLQQWLRAAWRQLSDPSLTVIARRELRSQMKQYSADLRGHLQRMEACRTQPPDALPAFAKPELRILA